LALCVPLLSEMLAAHFLAHLEAVAHGLPWPADTQKMQLTVAPSTDRPPISGVVIRMVLVVAVFVVTIVFAADTLDHAIRQIGYLKTYSNGDYFESGPPTLRDAVSVFLWGSLLQMVLFGFLLVVSSRKRRTWINRLRPVSWIMLTLDVLFVVALLALTGAAVAI
jgi:hypothetical protein